MGERFMFAVFFKRPKFQKKPTFSPSFLWPKAQPVWTFYTPDTYSINADDTLGMTPWWRRNLWVHKAESIRWRWQLNSNRRVVETTQDHILLSTGFSSGDATNQGDYKLSISSLTEGTHYYCELSLWHAHTHSLTLLRKRLHCDWG